MRPADQNQWANVAVGMRTRMFLRTAEFPGRKVTLVMNEEEALEETRHVDV